MKKKISLQIKKCKHEKATKAQNERREKQKEAMLKAKANGVLFVAAKTRTTDIPNDL